MTGLQSSYFVLFAASFTIRCNSAFENITFLFPDDACTLSPPVFVDEQLRYHFGYYGSDIDTLCNTIEFHGKDTKEIYANEFTMCFQNVGYRDHYCALSVKILEGSRETAPKHEFNCTRKPNEQKICLKKNQALFVRLDVGWGYDLSEMSFVVEAPKQYKRFWEYSIVQAVSGIAGGTVLLCVLIGLFLCYKNKGNKKNRNRRPVSMQHVQSKDRRNFRKAESVSKSVSIELPSREKIKDADKLITYGGVNSSKFSRDLNANNGGAGTEQRDKQTVVVNGQNEKVKGENHDMEVDNGSVKIEPVDPKNINKAHAWMTSATKRTFNKF